MPCHPEEALLAIGRDIRTREPEYTELYSDDNIKHRIYDYGPRFRYVLPQSEAAVRIHQEQRRIARKDAETIKKTSDLAYDPVRDSLYMHWLLKCHVPIEGEDAFTKYELSMHRRALTL